MHISVKIRWPRKRRVAACVRDLHGKQPRLPEDGAFWSRWEPHVRPLAPAGGPTVAYLFGRRRPLSSAYSHMRHTTKRICTFSCQHVAIQGQTWLVLLSFLFFAQTCAANWRLRHHLRFSYSLIEGDRSSARECKVCRRCAARLYLEGQNQMALASGAALSRSRSRSPVPAIRRS